jgi:hypothetical protein
VGVEIFSREDAKARRKKREPQVGEIACGAWTPDRMRWIVCK